MAQPRQRSITVTILLGLTLLLAIVLAGLSLLDVLVADGWWPGALALYLPRWPWAVPGLLLTAALLMTARRWAWAPLLCLLWVAGPYMGFHWSFTSSREDTLRVMTCNIKGDVRNSAALAADLARYRPDLVFFQEWRGELSRWLTQQMKGWHLISSGPYVIASRFPLDGEETVRLSFPGDPEGQQCLRCRLHRDHRTVTLYDIHLLSPRGGLTPFRDLLSRHGSLDDAIRLLRENVEDRLTQARALQNLIRQERGPVILAGDLNAPDNSRVCALLRDAGLHDAFAQGGRGYGYTYGHFLIPGWLTRFRVSFIRIDHLMLSPEIESRGCWTGTPEASDHRPVFADLRIR